MQQHDDDIQEFISLFANCREEIKNDELRIKSSCSNKDFPLKSVLIPLPNIRPSSKNRRDMKKSNAQPSVVFHSTLPHFRNFFHLQDFRLDIPQMVVNVQNSGDFAMISDFFRLICVPSCGYINSISKFYSDSRSPSRPSPPIYDVDSMIRVIQTNLAIFPDLIMRLHRVEYSPGHLNRGTKIDMYFTMKGTKTFVPLLEAQHQQFLFASAWTMNYCPVVHQTSSLEEVQQSTTRNRFDINPQQTILDPKPCQMLFFPQISFLLNEQNYVTAIEFTLIPGSKIFRNKVPFTQ